MIGETVMYVSRYNLQEHTVFILDKVRVYHEFYARNADELKPGHVEDCYLVRDINDQAIYCIHPTQIKKIL